MKCNELIERPYLSHSFLQQKPIQNEIPQYLQSAFRKTNHRFVVRSKRCIVYTRVFENEILVRFW